MSMVLRGNPLRSDFALADGVVIPVSFRSEGFVGP